jgi:hypothetical protein
MWHSNRRGWALHAEIATIDAAFKGQSSWARAFLSPKASEPSARQRKVGDLAGERLHPMHCGWGADHYFPQR